MSPRDVPAIVFDGQEGELHDRLERWRQRQERVIVGICGLPGVGKSTLASWLHTALPPDASRVVSMDGFHLSNARLAAQGLLHRKGAIETFDADGYAALLKRLWSGVDDVVYAPAFHRDIEEPIAGSIAVERHVPIVITEGNYLLSDDPAWQRARNHIEEIWFVDVDSDVRRQRLIERHVRFGKTAAEARSWVDEVDEYNARQIESRRHSADLAVRLAIDIDVPAVR